MGREETYVYVNTEGTDMNSNMSFASSSGLICRRMRRGVMIGYCASDMVMNSAPNFESIANVKEKGFIIVDFIYICNLSLTHHA